MKRNNILVGIFVTALTVSTAFAGDLLDGGPKLQPKESADTHRKVTGTVERIESDMVFLKTNEGTTRNFAVKEGNRQGLKSIQPGDQVSLELDEGNSIIDIHKDGAMAKGDQKGTGDRGGLNSGDAGHKSVVGTVETFDAAQKILILKSDQGKSESYQVKDAAATKLNGIKKGDKVTLEIDEQNRVMDAHS